ncbi:hypothetical protein [Streptomyces sp. NPDC050560]|uniref:hypothetical protein n=1 Tax=Streptomyces sp. NPDC050560 TaxID=3365630 RepID=UPI0037ADF813
MIDWVVHTHAQPDLFVSLLSRLSGRQVLFVVLAPGRRVLFVALAPGPPGCCGHRYPAAEGACAARASAES